MRYLKLFLLAIGLILLGAQGRLPGGPEHIDRPAREKTVEEQVQEAKARIKESCTLNYKISYYTGSRFDEALKKDPKLVWDLFTAGDLECDWRGECLYKVEVPEEGLPRFLCYFPTKEDE